MPTYIASKDAIVNNKVPNYLYDDNIFTDSTEKDIICNLDNYKDYSHYSEKINEYIAEKMKRESKLLNKDNYKEYFSNAREFFMNYNYDEIFY